MQTLKIAVDSREQDGHHDLGGQVVNGMLVEYETAGLDIFDYSAFGDWSDVKNRKLKAVNYSLERKSHSDFMSSFFISANAKREFAKIEKAKQRFEGLPICYVCEFDHEAIKYYDYSRFVSGAISAKVVLAKIRQLRYMGVHIIMCRSKAIAEYEIVNMLRQRHRDIQKQQRAEKRLAKESK